VPSITSIHNNNNEQRVRFIENVQESRDTETNNLKFKDILSKSSKSEPSANLLSNGQGEVTKPAPNSELQRSLKDLLKKYK
jgi:hypothetical protein